ncbi:MAG: hypothetical protein WC526_02605 [Patescibacteria group bacterium]
MEPYSIYINHRPFRIAFLINPKSDTDWVDKIIAYNREKWGGKFNPIIFTDGVTITDSWWKFLRGYDPDIIHSTVVLSEELKKKIHTFLSPLQVEEIRPENTHINISSHPISILPTEKNISQIGIPLFEEKNDLILFEVVETTPEIIKTFLDRNFGLLKQEPMMTSQLKKALETCHAKKYKVIDEPSLNEALLDLGDWHTKAIFPAQICSLPNSFKEAEHAYNNEKFEIIVGDTVDEFTHFWNRTLEMSTWLRTYFTQLWLPKQLAESELLRPGLGKFINRYAGSTGNHHGQEAHFTTFSLTETEIQTVANLFNALIWHPKKFTLFTEHPIPDYNSRDSYFFLRQGLDFHRAHSNEEYLILDEPDVEQGVMGGENWFTDLYIQYRPERFKNIIGQDYWWQLPKRNSIVHDLPFFNKKARINEHGMFSVLMSRKTRIHGEDTTLVIKIPEDKSIFYALLCGESFDCIKNGDKERSLSRPFYRLQRSDKGMYLSGVLGLFPDLLNAHQLFEKRYWRHIFSRMSNQNLEQDEDTQQKLLNKLTKKINSGMDFKGSDSAKKWLAHTVVNIAKDYSKEEIDLNYNILRDLAKQETEEYNQKPSVQTIEFNEEDFKNELSDMIESNIFLLGVKPRCHRCGYRIWYQINDIKQKIKCRGCGYEFSLPAEPEWFYRLNSLIRAAVSLHGTIPLLITLGQVMGDARSAAIFMPSIELSKKKGTNKETIDTELDLVCIKDGQFVIGEIKQSVSLFGVNDFKKMSDVAKLVRPDTIIFTSMDKEGPNALVKDNIKKLKEELAYLEINVEWYPIHYWVFDPRPVR